MEGNLIEFALQKLSVWLLTLTNSQDWSAATVILRVMAAMTMTIVTLTVRETVLLLKPGFARFYRDRILLPAVRMSFGSANDGTQIDRHLVLIGSRCKSRLQSSSDERAFAERSEHGLFEHGIPSNQLLAVAPGRRSTLDHRSIVGTVGGLEIAEEPLLSTGPMYPLGEQAPKTADLTENEPPGEQFLSESINWSLFSEDLLGEAHGLGQADQQDVWVETGESWLRFREISADHEFQSDLRNLDQLVNTFEEAKKRLVICSFKASKNTTATLDGFLAGQVKHISQLICVQIYPETDLIPHASPRPGCVNETAAADLAQTLKEYDEVVVFAPATDKEAWAKLLSQCLKQRALKHEMIEVSGPA